MSVIWYAMSKLSIVSLWASNSHICLTWLEQLIQVIPVRWDEPQCCFQLIFKTSFSLVIFSNHYFIYDDIIAAKNFPEDLSHHYIIVLINICKKYIELLIVFFQIGEVVQSKRPYKRFAHTGSNYASPNR